MNDDYSVEDEVQNNLRHVSAECQHREWLEERERARVILKQLTEKYAR